MAIITYEKFLEIFNFIKGEPEFEFYFTNTKDTYYIVKYKDEVWAERCCYCDESELLTQPMIYSSFEELYITKSVDGICLKDEWENIADIVVNDTFCLVDPDDVDDLFAVYKELNEKYEKRQNSLKHKKSSTK